MNIAHMKIAFLGGGNMASAILEGCIKQGLNPAMCHVVEINPERCAYLKQEYGVNTHETITSEIADCTLILLAVKPQNMQEIAEILSTYLKKAVTPIIMSIAAGIPLAKLSLWLNHYPRIIRAMPNMAALVHASMTGLAALPTVSEEERSCAEKLMMTIGDVLWLSDEAQLDAVTAVSGSGPAYVFYFIEALQKAGELLKLSPQQAHQLALKTFEGASRLALSSLEPVDILRKRVTSKGGTTEAAIQHLDDTQTKKNFIEAVQAANNRSKELGK